MKEMFIDLGTSILIILMGSIILLMSAAMVLIPYAIYVGSKYHKELLQDCSNKGGILLKDYDGHPVCAKGLAFPESK